MKKRLIIGFSLILSLVLGALAVYQLFFVADYPLRYREEIVHFADIHSVPADLVCAVINAESGYDGRRFLRRRGGVNALMPTTTGEIAKN